MINLCLYQISIHTYMHTHTQTYTHTHIGLPVLYYIAYHIILINLRRPMETSCLGSFIEPNATACRRRFLSPNLLLLPLLIRAFGPKHFRFVFHFTAR